ncbi:hypothetical protein DL1_17490 [Thioclava dalianensis]|uniref:Superfamily III holin-X n=2 Tax=Thioclava dalianensis TaxID=1185766 RepID=A0A074TFM4_9RHOB|nr:hypothetical protein DL1_17490 [Thioclava dalianensis]
MSPCQAEPGAPMNHDDAANQNTGRSNRTITELFARVIEQTREIARAEADLVRAEAVHRASLVKNAALFGAVALIFGIGAVGPLVQSAIYALEWLGLDRAPATLIAGATLAILAIILALVAVAQLKRAGRAPKRIKDNLSADMQTLKEPLK